MHSIALGRDFDPACINAVAFIVNTECDWAERALNYMQDVAEVLDYSTEKKMSPIQVIQLMLPYFDRGEIDVHIVRDINGWRIESGLAFELEHGQLVALHIGHQRFRNLDR